MTFNFSFFQNMYRLGLNSKHAIEDTPENIELLKSNMIAMEKQTCKFHQALESLEVLLLPVTELKSRANWLKKNRYQVF